MTEDPSGWRKALRAWFEYAGLWALTIAWPVYQNIASGPEALTTHGSRRPDIALVVLLVSLLVPTVIALIEAGIRWLATEKGAMLFRALVLGSFIALFAWQFLTGEDLGQPIRLLVPLLIWAAATYLYLRSDFVRNFTGILGLATPVVIIAFFVRYPISYEVLPHESPDSAAKVDSDTPVVVVVFDELPQAALEDETRKIDSEMFPGFGELADSSTWYPDMTTVADHTVVALPAILTGETPEKRTGETPLPPGLPSFPDNLCATASSGGYEVFAYEPITDLCARTYGTGTRVSSLLARGISSGDDLFPTELENKAATALTKPFRTPWNEIGLDRDDAFDAFIEDMPATKGSVNVLHIALPHVSWEYMPSGSTYTPEPLDRIANIMPGTKPEANHFLQQMLLQLSFTDRKLRQIIDRMKDEGIWDESLFVVTADHGASFIPASSRRALTEENAGWVLPVPLFIKFPDQKKGKVVRGPVDSLDIAPTVVDVLNGTAPDELGGRSLRGKTSLPPRDQLDIQAYGGFTRLPRNEVDKQLAEARDQRNAAFGNGNLFALGGHPELIGQAPGQAERLTPIPAKVIGAAAYRNVDPSSGVLPSYLRAVLSPDEDENPGDLAVAVNDRIVATARAWPYYSAWVTAVNLPDEAFRPGNNEIEFYSIPAD